MERSASFDRPQQTEKVEEYLNFIDILGLSSEKKDLLQSLVETKKRGKLTLAIGNTRQEVLIDPNMEENETAVHILHAFDVLASEANQGASPSDVEATFEEMKLH